MTSQFILNAMNAQHARASENAACLSLAQRVERRAIGEHPLQAAFAKAGWNKNIAAIVLAGAGEKAVGTHAAG